jgi:hypothetical protein
MGLVTTVTAAAAADRAVSMFSQTNAAVPPYFWSTSFLGRYAAGR